MFHANSSHEQFHSVKGAKISHENMTEESLTNSRGSRVQSRGRGSNVAAGENDLEFEVT